MVEQVLAAVRTGPGMTELRELPMPDIDEAGALLEVEVAGICGTDVKMYATPPTTAPVIMGHEKAGVISRAGREFAEREYRHCAPTDWRANPNARRSGCTVVAPEQAGAAPAIVTGTTRDAARLDLAKRSGTDAVIDIGRADPLARVVEPTGGPRRRQRAADREGDHARRVDHVIRPPAGENGEDAIHISLLPWKENA